MRVTKFPRLTIWLLYFAKGDLFGSSVSSRGFSKKLPVKIGDFALRKKGREKARMAKVVKCRHQVTWAQKSLVKK